METATFNELNSEKLFRVSEVLKAIAHPTRLKVLELLQNFERLSVNELVEKTQTEQSLLSNHLKVMKAQQILKASRNGKNIFYTLTDASILKIFDCLEGCSIV